MNASLNRIPTWPALLGYAGVLPFASLALAFALTHGPMQELALRAFLVYGAVILSFLGGIRWGAAARSAQPRGGEFVLAVLPSLWAVFLLWWADPSTAAWGMFAGFVLLGLADGFFVVPGLPSWMQRLRLRLTAAVAACHLPVLAMLLFT